MEQSAVFLGCLLLLQEICPMFTSIVDGGHRITTSLMSLAGFIKDEESLGLKLSPLDARLDIALKMPKVQMVFLLPSTDKHNPRMHFEKNVCKALLLSMKIAETTTQTCMLYEPVHE